MSEERWVSEGKNKVSREDSKFDLLNNSKIMQQDINRKNILENCSTAKATKCNCRTAVMVWANREIEQMQGVENRVWGLRSTHQWHCGSSAGIDWGIHS